jgi:hypothetical protein
MKPNAKDVSDGVGAACATFSNSPEAEMGDKTLVDVLAPASATLIAVADGHDLATLRPSDGGRSCRRRS